MKTLNVHEAKTHLSALIDAVQRGEEVVILRYGKPAARLVAAAEVQTRTLGFYPIDFKSDLTEPTSEDVLRDFESA